MAHGLVQIVLKLELGDVPALLDARPELSHHLPEHAVAAAAAGRPDVVHREAGAAAGLVHVHAVQGSVRDAARGLAAPVRHVHFHLLVREVYGAGGGGAREAAGRVARGQRLARVAEVVALRLESLYGVRVERGTLGGHLRAARPGEFQRPALERGGEGEHVLQLPELRHVAPLHLPLLELFRHLENLPLVAAPAGGLLVDRVEAAVGFRHVHAVELRVVELHLRVVQVALLCDGHHVLRELEGLPLAPRDPAGQEAPREGVALVGHVVLLVFELGEPSVHDHRLPRRTAAARVPLPLGSRRRRRPWGPSGEGVHGTQRLLKLRHQSLVLLDLPHRAAPRHALAQGGHDLQGLALVAAREARHDHRVLPADLPAADADLVPLDEPHVRVLALPLHAPHTVAALRDHLLRQELEGLEHAQGQDHQARRREVDAVVERGELLVRQRRQVEHSVEPRHGHLLRVPRCAGLAARLCQTCQACSEIHHLREEAVELGALRGVAPLGLAVLELPHDLVHEADVPAAPRAPPADLLLPHLAVWAHLWLHAHHVRDKDARVAAVIDLDHLAELGVGAPHGRHAARILLAVHELLVAHHQLLRHAAHAGAGRGDIEVGRLQWNVGFESAVVCRHVDQKNLPRRCALRQQHIHQDTIRGDAQS
mmetsp:Transcript_10477/g.20809  ORF Transcript_10477/g.20809 Transcript_10477/m.20809 type:complete len:653 (+) Transcript_10477:192-2150(+)